MLAAALAAASVPAGAQTLQRLTVQSFTLSTDAPRPAIDEPFHLIVSLRVRESVMQINNLELPMLAQLELLGDERSTISGARGSEYREVITVVAHTPGAIPLAPATLQARDARDGKAKQWYTNGLTLYAGQTASQAIRSNAGVLLDAVANVARWVLTLALIALFFWSLFWVFVVLPRRRPPAAQVVEPPAAVAMPVPRPRTRAEQVRDALLVLNAERTRSGALRVRSAIWRMIGAPEGETLGDTLRRPGANEAPLKDVLVSLERGAFTYDDDLAQAIGDACGALERYVAALGADDA